MSNLKKITKNHLITIMNLYCDAQKLTYVDIWRRANNIFIESDLQTISLSTIKRVLKDRPIDHQCVNPYTPRVYNPIRDGWMIDWLKIDIGHQVKYLFVCIDIRTKKIKYFDIFNDFTLSNAIVALNVLVKLKPLPSTIFLDYSSGYQNSKMKEVLSKFESINVKVEKMRHSFATIKLIGQTLRFVDKGVSQIFKESIPKSIIKENRINREELYKLIANVVNDHNNLN